MTSVLLRSSRGPFRSRSAATSSRWKLSDGPERSSRRLFLKQGRSHCWPARGDASIDLLQRVTGQSDKAMQESVKSLEEKGVLELYADEETGIKGAMITAKGVGVWGYFQIWEKTPEQRL